MPIWGNGKTYGPIYEAHRQAYTSTRSAFDRLAVHIEDTTGGDWANGDAIYFVRFIYLY
jgi:hypothetical protein